MRRPKYSMYNPDKHKPKVLRKIKAKVGLIVEVSISTKQAESLSPDEVEEIFIDKAGNEIAEILENATGWDIYGSDLVNEGLVEVIETNVGVRKKKIKESSLA